MSEHHQRAEAQARLAINEIDQMLRQRDYRSAEIVVRKLILDTEAACLREVKEHTAERQRTWGEHVNALNRNTQFGVDSAARAGEARYFTDYLEQQAARRVG